MTDYLEGLLPGQGGALEEELERLEGLLAPLPPAAAPDTARAEGPEAPAAERDAAGARSDLPPAQRGENRPSGAPGAGTAAGGELPAEDGPPLWADVVRLEALRAGMAGGLPDGRERRRSWADLPLPGSRAGTGPGQLPAPAGPAGQLTGGSLGRPGGQGWAEQADRIFRRDSRRYDGGFYLY